MNTLLLMGLIVSQPPATTPPPKFDIMDWTPRPALGKSEPWERKKDPDWDDARLQAMDTGPTFNGTFQYTVGRTIHKVYKGTAVKLTVKDATGNTTTGGILFDRNTCSLVAAWTGGYLEHSPRRFGLLNTPKPVGTMLFANLPTPAWANSKTGTAGARITIHTAPLDDKWVKFKGLYFHEDKVVFQYTVGGTEMLESARLVLDGGRLMLARTFTVAAHTNLMRLTALGKVLEFPTSTEPKTYTHLEGNTGTPAADDHAAYLKPGKARWGEPISTKFVSGEAKGAFALDTFTIPYENKHKALFFCTGLDFLADGRIAMCTCHGDVWLITPKGETCSWQRYATGLYHPLGLKVVEDKVVVLERGQLTRLHDNNNDGEADYYECLANKWDTGGGEHSYDTCLETDPQGNFYHFKTGDTETPTGGTLLKTSKDGSRTEIFATGFRHPIGMGMSNSGIVTGADQEGNYVPATRIDQYKQGGFYGDLRAHHRATPPITYDGPLCWLPREVDNSAGGQVWVPEKTFGELAGLPLHLSYGRCRAFVLLRQEVGDMVQGGVADLGVQFLSGICRGRFHKDGHLYVCGLNGWQTAAQADGCLQRLRITGSPIDKPIRHEIFKDGIRLTFARKLDETSASNVAHVNAAMWNYIWSDKYGSKRWKVSNPRIEGQDDIPISSVGLINDGKTLEIKFAGGAKPVMQLHVGYNVKATDGTPIVGSVYLTVHKVP